MYRMGISRVRLPPNVDLELAEAIEAVHSKQDIAQPVYVFQKKADGFVEQYNLQIR